MKKIALMLLSLTLVLTLNGAAYAENEKTEPKNRESIDWPAYSLDDLDFLISTREDLDEKIAQLQRQYAIENGNRKIELETEKAYTYVGKAISIVPTVTRVVDDAPEQTDFVWSSSDENIATVSKTGSVTGISEGKATISCTAADDDCIFAEAEIEVVLPVKKVTIMDCPTELILSEFDSTLAEAQLSCTIEPENAFNKEIEWSSSDENIATVDEAGNVLGVAPGRVTITVKSKDEFSTNPPQNSVTLIVSQAASAIDLDKSECVVQKNSTEQISAVVLPENTTDKSVIWESDDEEIATVNQYGQIKGVKCGTTTIYCKSKNTLEVTAKCSVEVVQLVTGIKSEDANQTITIGCKEKADFQVEVEPEDATDKTLLWESSDEEIARVTEHGQVEGISGGSAKITCSAADGSGKSVSFTVNVSNIAVDEEEYNVTDKGGLSFDVVHYGESADLAFNAPSQYFNISVSEGTARDDGETEYTVNIEPISAGSAYIEIQDKSVNISKRRILINIDHSAAYDKTSYPTGDYTAILRNPSDYKNSNISIYGRVLQVSNGLFSSYLRVGTGGYGYYDNVFYVKIPWDYDGPNIIEDDYLTIYGVCTGTESYTSILGASITIPSMEAEKIILQ